MNIQKVLIVLSFTLPLVAGDVMVERMQSVVDEVSELRKRYEDSVHKNEQCLSQVKEQNELLDKKGFRPSSDKEKLDTLENENIRLKKAHETAKQESLHLKELTSKVEKLNKENKRLNTSAQILVEKNQSLLEQLNKLKRNKEEPSNISLLSKDKQNLEKQLKLSQKTVKDLEKDKVDLEEKIENSKTASRKSLALSLLTLQEENKKLSKSLNNCENRPKTYAKNTKKVCIDDNPFPKLLKKEVKPVSTKPLIQKNISNNKTSASSVYRIKGESTIFDKPNGQAIEIWEDTRSFTSNISKEKWVKITGFFVDRKWRKAQREMWVKEEKTLKR